ncbi:hypothetical protein [Xenorhabdus sp. KJ12.1]|uniref:hypothetical protein n=1 Tax=Xenorhabdus sp. KJ12.1 TaxID=1851571 RepID=UPI000C04850B|nr:hypothetical protein [Xenorhabdus sp. KJ12.1]PHM71215.1 hypothetical protein Xekj_01241 [Xenorhabdus sp. KJ12.1]
MATENLDIDFKGTDVFQGSKIIIIATYTGDTSKHQTVSDSSDITVENTSSNQNVIISPYKDKYRYKHTDNKGNKIIAPYIIEIKNSTENSSIKLEFSIKNVTNSTAAGIKDITLTQHPYSDHDLQLKSLFPIVIGSNLIEDFSPAPDGQLPDNQKNAHLNVLIYPRNKSGVAMNNCQIALKVTNIEYMRLYNGETEVPPFNDNMYYINTGDDGNLDVTIFARQMASSYFKEVIISNVIGDETAPPSKNILIITKKILPSDNFDNPTIEYLDGDEVPPPSSKLDISFNANLPYSDTLTSTDTIYIMSKVNNQYNTLCTSDLYGNRKNIDEPFKIPYDIFTPLQINTLFYYVLKLNGNIYRSRELLFKLGQSNDYLVPSGNLERVTIQDSSGLDFDEHHVLGIDSVKNGLTCIIPVGDKNQVQLGDKVDYYIYVIRFDPETDDPSVDNPLIDSKSIKPKDVQAKQIHVSIPQSALMGFNTDSQGHPSPIAIYYINNGREYSKTWQAYIDTQPSDL